MIRTKGYWPNGNQMFHFPHKNGIPHGIHKWWRKNGTQKYEYPYKDGKFHGECKVWNEKGILIRIIPYKNGQVHGTLKEFYDNGKQKCEFKYDHGLKHGKGYQWTPSGTLFDKSKWTSGQEIVGNEKAKIESIALWKELEKLKEEIKFQGTAIKKAIDDIKLSKELKTQTESIGKAIDNLILSTESSRHKEKERITESYGNTNSPIVRSFKAEGVHAKGFHNKKWIDLYNHMIDAEKISAIYEEKEILREGIRIVTKLVVDGHILSFVGTARQTFQNIKECNYYIRRD